VTAIGTVRTLAGEPLLGLDPSIPSSLEAGGFSFTSDSSEEPAQANRRARSEQEISARPRIARRMAAAQSNSSREKNK